MLKSIQSAQHQTENLTLEKELFTTTFTHGSQVDWQCPTCGKGLLRIDYTSFFCGSSAYSIKAQSHSYFDPSEHDSRYSCLLKCSNENCKETISSAGKACPDLDVEFDENGDANQVWKDFYTPLYFHPPLKFFSIPQKTPMRVVTILLESFAQFFASPDTAGNLTRVAVEALLDDLKVPRKGSKNKRLMLHNRILKLPPRHASSKELLEAVKWIGNAGSHSDEALSPNDVLEAYEIMELVLKNIYDDTTQRVTNMAKAINNKARKS